MQESCGAYYDPYLEAVRAEIAVVTESEDAGELLEVEPGLFPDLRGLRLGGIDVEEDEVFRREA